MTVSIVRVHTLFWQEKSPSGFFDVSTKSIFLRKMPAFQCDMLRKRRSRPGKYAWASIARK
jgi:hypothetical protein